MEGSLKDLAKYRLEKSVDALKGAEDNLNIGQYGISLNRSYYAVFHAMRAANSLYGFDSSKHSGVTSYFNHTFLKENLIGNSNAMSGIIKDTRLFREKSDYDDFFLAAKSDAETQLAGAKQFVAAVAHYLEERGIL